VEKPRYRGRYKEDWRAAIGQVGACILAPGTGAIAAAGIEIKTSVQPDLIAAHRLSPSGIESSAVAMVRGQSRSLMRVLLQATGGKQAC
jgi:hypothetical protein